MSIRSWLFVIGISVFGSAPAQTTAPGAAGAPGAVAPTQVPSTAAAKEGVAKAEPTKDAPPGNNVQVWITGVSAVEAVPSGARVDGKAAGKTAPPVVELRQGIGVRVQNLNTLLERARAANKNVVLFLDKRPMKDLTPYPQSDPAGNVLYFELKRTEASREVWTYLLGKPGRKPRPVEVSVGLEDGYALAAAGNERHLILLKVMPTSWLIGWASLVLFLLFCSLRLGKESDMLRDSGPPPANGERKSFSLARVQLATWTFLILASYLFIGLITGDYTTSITDSVLALMGISAGTAIGSSIIDNNPSRLPAGTTATAALALPPADIAAGPAVVAAGAVVAPGVAGPAAVPAVGAPTTPARVVVVVRPAPSTTGRWWKDILMDEEGVNFHRFQMAAWTLVLGIVFLRQVYDELAMPEFNASLLALIGISSGTYLGLKITAEKPGVT